jgi:hypothetical protein
MLYLEIMERQESELLFQAEVEEFGRAKMMRK